jgi:polyhydroxyalkanoate synthesis regulator phasin
VSEPRAGEECRQFVEDLERRTEHAKGQLGERERQHPEAERQNLLFTTLTAGQLENKLDRTEILQVAG